MLFNPLKIFFPVSMFLLISGSIWGVYGYFATSRFPNSALLIVIMGILTFLIGLIADQIAMLNRIKR